jgi:nicotinamide-nucleotide amidase
MEPASSGSAATTATRRASDAASRPQRSLSTARIIAVGSELTSGETRDSNGAELAADLSGRGLRVTGVLLLPDDRVAIAAAFRSALDEADLVVSTGGLGPTPDDLTREGLADAIGETPVVDPALEAWVRGLWERRAMPFPESNIKQAWLVPSATALANGHGTAPGWWVGRSDGHVAVLLPGPPREMRPMWAEQVVPRLAVRSAGRASAVRLLRLAGIGESHAADLLGRDLLEASNPDVATFARADGVDVRVVALAGSPHAAAVIADAAATRVRTAVGEHVWSEGAASWSDVVDRVLAARALRLEIRERGTGGTLIALLGAAERLVAASLTAPSADETVPLEDPPRAADRATLTLSVLGAPTGRDLTAAIALDAPDVHVRERVTAFLDDEQGRMRAAVAAAWALVRALGDGRRPA